MPVIIPSQFYWGTNKYDPILANNSWQDIARAARLGSASRIWAVGDEIDIALTTGEVLTLQIYDFNHDDLTSGGMAGITFGLKNLMATRRVMNSTNTSVGGFAGSEIYSWLSRELYNSLPADLQPVIKSVNKRTSVGNKGSDLETNSMKIFLFSEVECFGSVRHSAAGEGAQYPIFTDDTSRIKRLANGAGNKDYWWQRSPFLSYATGFCNVDTYGSWTYTAAAYPYGICFGFCV